MCIAQGVGDDLPAKEIDKRVFHAVSGVVHFKYKPQCKKTPKTF